jgi:hypothetical protein
MPRGRLGKSMRKAMRGSVSSTQPKKSDVDCLSRKMTGMSLEKAQEHIAKTMAEDKINKDNLSVTHIHYVNAEMFLKNQVEQIMGGKVESMWTPEEQRTPNMMPVTNIQLNVLYSKLLRLYGNYSTPGLNIGDFTPNTLALSFLASHQLTGMMKKCEKEGIEYVDPEGEETFPEYR